MPVSNLTLVERIARVLAGRDHSINAEGDDPSGGADRRRDLARICRRRAGDPAHDARAGPGDGRGGRRRRSGSGWSRPRSASSARSATPRSRLG